MKRIATILSILMLFGTWSWIHSQKVQMKQAKAAIEAPQKKITYKIWPKDFQTESCFIK